jgi:Ca2+/Na+ antiporter
MTTSLRKKRFCWQNMQKLTCQKKQKKPRETTQLVLVLVLVLVSVLVSVLVLLALLLLLLLLLFLLLSLSSRQKNAGSAGEKSGRGPQSAARRRPGAAGSEYFVVALCALKIGNSGIRERKR